MKTLITAAALTIATLTAFAQEATPAPEFDKFVSTRTRAEVRNALLAAVANGTHRPPGEAAYAPEYERFVATQTRAAVRGELLAAIARGEPTSYGEASPEPLPLRHAGPIPAAALAKRGTNALQ